MYDYIKGTLAVKTPTYLVVDNNGIGYHINVSLNTFAALKDNAEALLHTVLVVREDAHLLFGFATPSEKDVFNKLVSVSGIGPSTAIVMLSNMNADEISRLITQGNTAALTKIKGIGAKTAQRLVLELKDKMHKTEDSLTGMPVAAPAIVPAAGAEAVSALVMLGYSKTSAEAAVQKVELSEPGLAVEHIIRRALKIM
jgi:Holliday junction DNA helicase RuvA